MAQEAVLQIDPPSDTPEQAEQYADKKPVRRIGIARGMKLYADDYDIDAPDPDILEMFEVL